MLLSSQKNTKNRIEYNMYQDIIRIFISIAYKNNSIIYKRYLPWDPRRTTFPSTVIIIRHNSELLTKIKTNDCIKSTNRGFTI
jgi:hypothetical protein